MHKIRILPVQTRLSARAIVGLSISLVETQNNFGRIPLLEIRTWKRLTRHIDSKLTHLNCFPNSHSSKTKQNEKKKKKLFYSKATILVPIASICWYMLTRKCARVQVPEKHFVKHKRKICLPLDLKTNESYRGKIFSSLQEQLNINMPESYSNDESRWDFTVSQTRGSWFNIK